MITSAVIRERVDANLEDEVQDVFEQLGSAAAQAMTLFFQKRCQGLPLEVRVPNPVTERTFFRTEAGVEIVRRDARKRWLVNWRSDAPVMLHGGAQARCWV